MKSTRPSRPRGRPRSFDTENALEQAMRVFWRSGYEGASLPRLTRAMGISRPSLYAAFGNKESLFRRALDHYTAGPASYFRDALVEKTARQVAERLMLGAADLLSRPKNPGGCLIVQGALSCAPDSDCIRKELAVRRAEGQTAIRKRFERARLEGDLAPNADPAALARFISAVIHGMAVQAAGGVRRKHLIEIARTALKAWPER